MAAELKNLRMNFLPFAKSTAGPSLPPDAYRHCSGQHATALLGAVDNLKRYKLSVVKSSLDSREKYSYLVTLLKILHFLHSANKMLKFKTFSFVDCVPDSSCYCVGKPSMESPE
jgi:hypothetical protein